MVILWVTAINFFLIFAKSFQQNSVVYKKWLWIPVGSFIMAAMEIGIIRAVSGEALPTWLLWLCMGGGATTGCWLGMWLHPILTGKGWGNK